MKLEAFKSLLTAPAPPGAQVVENGRGKGNKGHAYRIDPRVAAAIYVADLLGKPLLVAGEPGCGKTELGYAAALRLGLPDLHFFSVKSTSEARDLFYSYDALRRFHRAQLASLDRDTKAADVGAPDDYIAYEALGRAILMAHEPGSVEALVKGGRHPSSLTDPARRPKRSVVVIDEIDKAPRDFCNDMLREIEDLSFRVAELDGVERTPEIPKALRPLVFVTSNQETQLPDAFLRRCVFLWIDFPGEDELEKIVDAHLDPDSPDEGDGLSAANRDALIALLLRLRAMGPQKPPGVAELLDAARLLAATPGLSPDDWRRAPEWRDMLRHALVKLESDGDAFDKAFDAVRR